MRVEPLSPALLPAWRRLFEQASCDCYCRYWHFEGTKNEWLDRCAHRPEENAAEVPVATGLVALEGDDAVGWMKIAPRATVPKLRRLPVYKSRDLGSDEGVLSIGCFLVHPSRRGHGVARALLEAAPAYARSVGAVTLEAYPRRSEHRLADEEAWMGHLELFLAAGFQALESSEAGAFGAYPVLRLAVQVTS
jgi:GNAT superfamily N-acetyltransferase